MNKVLITGRIEQICFDPQPKRYTHGALSLGRNGGAEVMLSFPKTINIPEEVVGKYFAIEGSMWEDRYGDTMVSVSHMLPLNSRLKPCQEKPEWWEGRWEIDMSYHVATRDLNKVERWYHSSLFGSGDGDGQGPEAA